MFLPYKDFKKIVPEKTVRYLEKLLPLLDEYINDKKGIWISKNGTSKLISDVDSMFLIIATNTLFEFDSEDATFLSANNYNPTVLKKSLKTEKHLSEKEKEKLFNQFSKHFCLYEKEYNYAGLLPLRIVHRITNEKIKLYDEESNTPVLFKSIHKMYEYQKALKKYYPEKKQKFINELSFNFYENLSIDVINYINNASKIQNVLTSFSPKDAVVISLFCSIFINSNNEENKNVFLEKQAIAKYFKDKNITIDYLQKYFNFNIPNNILLQDKKELIEYYYYKKFIFNGVNKEKKSEDITIKDILCNVFNRDFTESIIIEKAFLEKNYLIEKDSEFKTNIELEMMKLEQNSEKMKITNFYKNIPKKEKDFIEFAAKTYTLITEKMKENNINFIQSKEDIDAASLFIASYFFPNKINDFFLGKGITIENLLYQLNLHITKEDIEKMPLDVNILIQRFYKFLHQGINKQKNTSSITIYDILQNLCNNNLNPSNIIENIILQYDTSIELKKDFIKQLDNFFDEKEKIRKRELTNKLFEGLSIETIEFLETVSKVHQKISQLEQFQEEDIERFSLLYTVLNYEDLKIKSFLKAINLEQYFNNNKIDIRNFNFDIDIIYNYYQKYIFSGNNKNLNKNEITIKNIISNVFNPNLNPSVQFKKFLKKYNLDIEQFRDFDNFYDEVLDKIEKDNIKNKIDELLSNCTNETKEYIYNVVRIHDVIIELMEQKKYDSNIVHNVHDIIEISMILGLFHTPNKVVQFLLKNKITENEILTYCKFDNDTFSLFEYVQKNLDLIWQYYKIYFDKLKTPIQIDELAKQIVNNNLNSSLFLEKMCAHKKIKYSILQEEIQTGENHILKLTLDEKINNLKNNIVPQLNVNSLLDILEFGESLSIHSALIHQESNSLEINDTHDDAIKTINGIINKLYVPEKKETPKGLINKLISLVVDEKTKETRIFLDTNVIHELHESINKNIENLKKELIGYDLIRKYIEIYKMKNMEYLNEIKEKTEQLMIETENLDSSNNMQFAISSNVTTHLKILKDKIHTFEDTNFLMKQELIKINQAIINHFITMNALITSRDVLLPLITSEIAMGVGIESENKSLEISSNVVQLFKDLLERNIEGTKENMNKLKNLAIDPETFKMIQNNIQNYLDEVKTSNEDLKNQKLSIDINKELILQKK